MRSRSYRRRGLVNNQTKDGPEGRFEQPILKWASGNIDGTDDAEAAPVEDRVLIIVVFDMTVTE